MSTITKRELIDRCKKLGISGYSNKNKNELIEIINKYINDSNQQKTLGQYFTISEYLQQYVFDKVKYKGENLLEPSFGAGHLLKKFIEMDSNYPITAYEIDMSIIPIIKFNNKQNIIYDDFIKNYRNNKYKTIIGNPPYVKQGGINLYIKFIKVCYELLDDNGEMIFIVPADFIKLTSASALIKNMIKHGSFTDFLFPHNEKLFDNASVDIVVFRYEKNLITNKCYMNDKEMICNNNDGIITFTESIINGNVLSENFDVYVGMVTGRDDIYRVEYGNIELLVDEDKIERYIYIENYPTDDIKINDYLLDNKEKLLERRIKKFNENNWYLWGAPRNIKSIKENWDKPCIYIKTVTRNKKVAFMDKVKYFGGTLLCLIPKNNNIDLVRIVDHLNSDEFQKNYIYSGRFKIGHKQISNASIII